MSDDEFKALLVKSCSWRTEDYKYICLGLSGNTYFSNDLDCDGTRYWSRKSFDKFLKRG